MMAEQDCDQELVRVARTVTLKPLCQTFVLCGADATNIVHIDAVTQVEQDYSRKFAQGMMNFLPQSCSDVMIANASSSVIMLAVHQPVTTTSTSVQKYIIFKLTSIPCTNQ